MRLRIFLCVLCETFANLRLKIFLRSELKFLPDLLPLSGTLLQFIPGLTKFLCEAGSFLGTDKIHLTAKLAKNCRKAASKEI